MDELERFDGFSVERLTPNRWIIWRNGQWVASVRRYGVFGGIGFVWHDASMWRYHASDFILV